MHPLETHVYLQGQTVISMQGKKIDDLIFSVSFSSTDTVLKKQRAFQQMHFFQTKLKIVVSSKESFNITITHTWVRRLFKL